MTEATPTQNSQQKGWLSWLVVVLGWLVCATFCLALTIGLEPYPFSYENFFPVVLILLFGNVFIFLFISSRWGGQQRRLFASVFRVCVGEGLLLAGVYVLGRFIIGH